MFINLSINLYHFKNLLVLNFLIMNIHLKFIYKIRKNIFLILRSKISINYKQMGINCIHNVY